MPISSLNCRSIDGALLSNYTTFRLGGPCKALIECRTPEELIATVKALVESNENYILIGGGSNLVVSDRGISLYVIRYLSEKPIISVDGKTVMVSGSTILDALSAFCADEGLSGLENTTGIPGTVGGAVVGNAGAFGKQVGDVLSEATLISPSGEVRNVNAEELKFTYRNSILKETKDIIVSVKFKLEKMPAESLMAKRAEILALRHSKHPDLTKEPCAGSFFRNIEPTSQAGKRQATGYFLEEAGGKSLAHGGAQIYSKHANIIVKSDGCTAQDVYELHLLMQKLAKEKFNLDLVREVRFVGPFNGADYNPKEIIW